MARGRPKKSKEDKTPLLFSAETEKTEVADETTQVPLESSPSPSDAFPPGEHWRQDGKQFDVLLQDPKEPNKFNSIEDTDSVKNAEDAANDIAFEDERIAIVWDRKNQQECYRINPNSKLE